MLDLDSSRRLAVLTDLEELVAAIERAGKGDETDWLEWKSEVDLTAKEGQAILSKALLAMANRDVDSAKRTAHGYAYVVFGAEPQRICGIQHIDPADLYKTLVRYVGNVRWRPFWLKIQAQDVLVAEIDPPVWGDPTFPARRDFSPILRRGAIYVRRGTQTAEALPDDVDMLSRRSAAAQPGLDIEVGISGGFPLGQLEVAVEDIDDWVREERSRLLGYRASPGSPAAILNTSAVRLMDKFGNRSRGEFEREVDSYLDECREALPEVVANVIAAAVEPCRIWARPRGELPYARVEIELVVTGAIVIDPDAYDLDDPTAGLPDRPRPWGTSLLTHGFLPLGISPAPTFTEGIEVRVDDLTGARHASLPEADLRPGKNRDVDELVLLALDSEVREVTVTWTATADGVRGTASGSITLPVGGEVVAPIQLVREELGDEAAG